MKKFLSVSLFLLAMFLALPSMADVVTSRVITTTTTTYADTCLTTYLAKTDADTEVKADRVAYVSTYIDYLGIPTEENAATDNPGVGLRLGLNKSLAFEVGYFPNGGEDSYEFNFGASVYVDNLFGRILILADGLDPAVRVGGKVDISRAFVEAGWEWGYARDGRKFVVASPGKVVLSAGLTF